MGTRNLTCVVFEGRYKVAQYGQWDGYPSGQGLTILNFLREQFNREQFLKNLSKCRFANDEEINSLWLASGAKPGDKFVNMEISKRFKEANPQLSRDTAAEVLSMIQGAKGDLPLSDSLNFAADSLFCEFAYVIDLDKGTFEVFKGFNHEPLSGDERFAFLAGKADQPHREEKYMPVKHVHTFHIDALPEEQEFLALLKPKDEEE